jgi:hypothetical protein
VCVCVCVRERERERERVCVLQGLQGGAQHADAARPHEPPKLNQTTTPT